MKFSSSIISFCLVAGGLAAPQITSNPLASSPKLAIICKLPAAKSIPALVQACKMGGDLNSRHLTEEGLVELCMSEDLKYNPPHVCEAVLHLETRQSDEQLCKSDSPRQMPALYNYCKKKGY